MRIFKIYIAAAALSLTLGVFGQGKPKVYVDSREMGLSPSSPCTAYVSSPDSFKIKIDAGSSRAGRPAGILISTGLLSFPVPFGPDKLEIDLSRLVYAELVILDGSGRGERTLAVPPGLPDGARFYVQGFVVPKNEPWPFRLSGLVKAIMYTGNKHFFVDGDVATTGNGSPYKPFKAIKEAVNAAKKAGGGVIHVDPLKSGDYQELVELGSNMTLYGHDWRNGLNTKPSVRAPVDGSGAKKRGSVVAMGTALAPLVNVTVKNLRILPSRRSDALGVKCATVDCVKNFHIHDCILEGTARGKEDGIRALVFIQDVTAEVDHCTIRDLNVNPSFPHGNVGVYGIVVHRSNQVTIHNCRLENFAGLPLPKGMGDYYICGIHVGMNKPGSEKNNVIISNNVIGPIVLPQTPKNQSTDVDMYGMSFLYGGRGSIRNNVIYMLDARKVSGAVHQVFGFEAYKAGKIEITNNIVQDLHYGNVSGSIKWAVAFNSSEGQMSYVVTHSCIWNVKTPFLGKNIKPGKMVIYKDPLLVPPVFALKPGSPCLGTGNPL